MTIQRAESYRGTLFLTFFQKEASFSRFGVTTKRTSDRLSLMLKILSLLRHICGQNVREETTKRHWHANCLMKGESRRESRGKTKRKCLTL